MAYVGKHWRIRAFTTPDKRSFIHTTVWERNKATAEQVAQQWAASLRGNVYGLEVR